MLHYKNYRKIYVGVNYADYLKIIADKIISDGIKAKDAYHVSCAIFAECDYFITVDERLLKYSSDEINLINSVESVKFWSDTYERQRDLG